MDDNNDNNNDGDNFLLNKNNAYVDDDKKDDVIVLSEMDEYGRRVIFGRVGVNNKNKNGGVIKDDLLLSHWRVKSLILSKLVGFTNWRNTDVLPSNNLDVASCLNYHLGLVSLSAPGKVNAGVIYQCNQNIQPNLANYLKICFTALQTVGHIKNHRQLLLAPGLRGYFIDIWRTLTLSALNVITPTISVSFFLPLYFVWIQEIQWIMPIIIPYVKF